MDSKREQLEILKDQMESLSKVGTWQVDLEKNDVFWSDGVFRMLGYEPQEFEVTFDKAVSVIHPEDRKKATDLMDSVLQNEVEYLLEKRLLTKSGKIIHVRSKANIFKDELGKPVKLVGVFQDISDFIESKRELEEQFTLTQEIIQNLPAIFFLFDQHNNILKWNRQLEILSQYSGKEIKEMIPEDFFRGDDKKLAIRHIQEVLEKGYSEVEIALCTKNEKKIPIFFTASVIHYENEKCLFGIGTDISTQHDLLKELQLLTDNTEEAFMYFDAQLTTISYNRQMEDQAKEIFGKEVKKGINLADLIKPEDREVLLNHVERVKKGEKINTIIQEDSEFFELRLKPVFSKSGKIAGIFLTSLNVTEKNEASRRLEESQQKLQQILDNSLDTICTIDPKGFFRLVSKSSKELWGYHSEELEGKRFLDFVIEDDKEDSAQFLKDIHEGKEFRNFHNHFWHKKGYIVPVVWSANWDRHQNVINCIARDATEKLQAEQQLKFSESRFKSLVQSGGDLIAILDSEGNYKYVSPTSSSILGIEPDYFIGKNAFDFIHPDDKEAVIQEFGRVAEEKSFNVEPFRFIDNKGEWRWLESHITNLLDEPSIQGIVANSRDVTKTIELQHLLRNATKLARVGGWEVNQITELHYWSPMTKEIHEVEQDFNPNINEAINFYHPDFREKVIDAVKKAQEYGEPFDFEAIIITAKGNERWVRAIGDAELIDGKCIRVFGSFQDIHDRKIVEERLKSISNNIPGVLFQFRLHPDGTDTVDLVSDGAQEMFGVPAADWIADPSVIWSNIEKGGELDHVLESIDNSAKKMSRWESSWRYIMPDGSVRYHQGIGNPERKSDGSIVWDSIIIDVTDKKVAEEAARRANLELEKYAKDLEISNKELEQFAYVASHDLQEPLRMVSSFLVQLEKKYGNLLDDKAKQYIYYAVDGAKRMRRIILDLLEFSKVGKYDEEKASVDIRWVVEEVCLLQRKKIEELDAEINFQELPRVYAHASPMVLLFQNLISNALKYSKPGKKPKIIIRAKELKKEWKFSIIDNGIGIEDQHFDKIFNIFQRLHGKSKYAGTGMGLAIAKKIVESEGGRIWLKSEKGIGSEFYFTIPKNGKEMQ